MSWETVDEWPSEKNAAVYRGAAEIVVARRDGLTPLERVRLWWQSTDELPVSSIARDVVVTPNYVYARTRGGSMRRVRRELLAEGRTESGRRQYSVPDGVDLVLCDRGGDGVEIALASKGQAKGEVKSWVSPNYKIPTGLVLIALLGAAIFFGHDYLDEGLHVMSMGHYNAESAYGVYACIGSCLAVVLVFFFYPRRLIVDRLGLRTIRGMLSGYRSTLPVETIERVEVQPRRVRRNRVSVVVYRVLVHVSSAKAPIDLRGFTAFQLNEAIDFAELCAAAWNVQLTSPARAQSWAELIEKRADGQ